MAGDLDAFTGELEPDEEYDRVLFDGTSFDGADAGNSRFLDCSFTGATFDGGRLRKARFTGVKLRDTRFVASDLAETGWQDVTLAGCALAGVQVFSASLRRVTFRDGKLDSVNFRGGTLTDVTFENCLLRDVDFGGATLRRVGFGGCTLAGADFTKAGCAEVDLRGAELGITAGYESLSGATIDSVQLVALAPLLARHLGITVAGLLPARPGAHPRPGLRKARRPVRARHRGIADTRQPGARDRLRTTGRSSPSSPCLPRTGSSATSPRSCPTARAPGGVPASGTRTCSSTRR